MVSSDGGRAEFLKRIVLGVLAAGGMAYHGTRKRSLTANGALAAFSVGFLTLAASWRSDSMCGVFWKAYIKNWYRFGFTLLLFYLSSSRLSKIGKKIKGQVEDGHEKESQRGAVQVLSCSVPAVIYALVYVSVVSLDDTPVSYKSSYLGSFLHCAYLGFFACCNGDTWASEIGTLSSAKTALLVTNLQEVPKGTNGGLSVLGTVSSIAGGLFIGAVYLVVGWLNVKTPEVSQLHLLWFGALLGFLGSMLDSIMGATMQESWVDTKTGRIVKPPPLKPTYKKVTGANLLTNEQVHYRCYALLDQISTHTRR